MNGQRVAASRRSIATSQLGQLRNLASLAKSCRMGQPVAGRLAEPAEPKPTSQLAAELSQREQQSVGHGTSAGVSQECVYEWGIHGRLPLCALVGGRQLGATRQLVRNPAVIVSHALRHAWPWLAMQLGRIASRRLVRASGQRPAAGDRQPFVVGWHPH